MVDHFMPCAIISLNPLNEAVGELPFSIEFANNTLNRM